MNMQREVRDLAWAVNSQSLIADSPAIARQAGHPVARQVVPEQVDPDHLVAFLNQSPSLRVGRYFERLILYWLKHLRCVEIVAQSLQIRDGNRTAGEIDLLFYDEQRRLTHWEIAVKFYLHFPQNSSLDSHFIGPNAADTFQRKMDRLFEHQLPRSKTHFPEVEIRQAFVKGRIFYHPNHRSMTALPTQMSPGHLRCVWIRSSEVDLISRAEGLFYRILHKPYWLSEETAQIGDIDLLSPADLVKKVASHFANDARPLLISSLATHDERLIESNRLFVVSDHWPDA